MALPHAVSQVCFFSAQLIRKSLDLLNNDHLLRKIYRTWCDVHVFKSFILYLLGKEKSKPVCETGLLIRTYSKTSRVVFYQGESVIVRVEQISSNKEANKPKILVPIIVKIEFKMFEL